MRAAARRGAGPEGRPDGIALEDRCPRRRRRSPTGTSGERLRRRRSPGGLPAAPRMTRAFGSLADDLTDLRGRASACGVARQVRDPRVARAGPSSGWASIERTWPVTEQLADRGEEQRPPSRAGARLDDPVRPKLADQLLVGRGDRSGAGGCACRATWPTAAALLCQKASDEARPSGPRGRATGRDGRRSSGRARRHGSASALIGRRRVRRAAAGRLPT